MTRKIGRYEVIAEIGRGGMATVYSAHDPLLNRDVAIKVLPPELLHDPTFRARFEREAKTIVALEHSAIVPVYDFGEADGQPYFVMRLMTGGSLSERIARGKLSMADAARIITRLAPALDEAHDKGIIHRDLKPGNILFDKRNDPYLSDFGIAKLSEAGATLTGDAIVGTPAYMSPEQGRGESDIDGRSDIYSMGIILYEMLTGQVPFQADRPTAQMLMHITAPIPNIEECCPDLPYGTQAVIARVLAKRKFVRYSTTAELAQALNAIVEGKEPASKEVSATMNYPQESSGADTTLPGARSHTPRRTPTPSPLKPAVALGKTPPPGPSRPQTPPQGKQPVPPTLNKPPVAGGQATPVETRKKGCGVVMQVSIVLALIVTVGIGFTIYSTVPFLAPKRTPIANLGPGLTLTAAAQILVPPPSSTPTEEPPTSTPTLEPSATSQPTYTPSAPTDTPVPSGPVIGGADLMAFVKDNDIWTAYLDGSKIKRLTTTGGSKWGLQWSPDGDAIIYVQGRCVYSVNIETGTPSQVVCLNWADYVSAFQISPDKKQVALSLSDGLFVLPYDLQMLSNIRRQDQLQAAKGCLSYTEHTKAVRWSTDGKALAVVVVSTYLGNSTEMVRVISIPSCGSSPVNIDEFPGARFTMNGLSTNQVIESFGWDGDKKFALSGPLLNGFGDMYFYNISTKKESVVNPIGKQCCYRDYQWSPDGLYMLFLYEDARYAKDIQVYYVPYGDISAGVIFTPIAFPDQFFTNPREKPMPILRPAR